MDERNQTVMIFFISCTKQWESGKGEKNQDRKENETKEYQIHAAPQWISNSDNRFRVIKFYMKMYRVNVHEYAKNMDNLFSLHHLLPFVIQFSNRL